MPINFECEGLVGYFNMMVVNILIVVLVNEILLYIICGFRYPSRFWNAK